MYISGESYPRISRCHGEIGMDRFPMFMEEFIRKACFFVEEYQGSEVGLLVGAFSHLEFIESKTMGKVTGTFHCHIDGIDFGKHYLRSSSIICLYMALIDITRPFQMCFRLTFMLSACWVIQGC